MRRNNFNLNNFLNLFSILLPILLGIIALYRWYLANSENAIADNESQTLPDACKNFSLVHGDLSKAHVFVIGENHLFDTQTFSCLSALLQTLKIQTYLFYHEGNRVTHWDEVDVTPDCASFAKNALSYQSWDNQNAIAEIKKAALTLGKINAITYLTSLHIQNDNDLYLFMKNTFLPELIGLLNDRRSLLSVDRSQYKATIQIVSEFTNAYEIFKSDGLVGFPTGNFFKAIFNKAFHGLQAQAPKPCITVNPTALRPCIENWMHSLSIRDASLKKHIQKERKKSKKHRHAAFFVAGANHVRDIDPAVEIALIQHHSAQ